MEFGSLARWTRMVWERLFEEHVATVSEVDYACGGGDGVRGAVVAAASVYGEEHSVDHGSVSDDEVGRSLKEMQKTSTLNLNVVDGEIIWDWQQ